MENLGEKIKRLRSEKGFSQANLHQNQSAVAQIENGYNSKPMKQTLLQIAKNLEIPLEELVKDTDWKNSSARSKEEGVVYSQLKFTLSLADDGEITVTPFPYPEFDSNGNRNKFCPETGAPLLTGCPKCKRPFTDFHAYCMGCGEHIFPMHSQNIRSYMGFGARENIYEILRKDKERINKAIGIFVMLLGGGPFARDWDSNLDPDVMKQQDVQEIHTKEEQLEYLNRYLIEETDYKYRFNDIEEYYDGLQSSNPNVVEFVIAEKFDQRFLSALIKELKRYRDSIPDAENVNIDGRDEEE